jgi:putative sterol carrier protein
LGDNGEVRFLSREWLDHLSGLTSAASPAAALSVHQRVTGGPDGDVDYVLRLAGGRVSFEPGPGPADVDLTADYETAAAISRGVLTPAAAFAAGRLRVGGSPAALVAHQEALAEVGRLLAGVAGETTY